MQTNPSDVMASMLRNRIEEAEHHACTICGTMTYWRRFSLDDVEYDGTCRCKVKEERITKRRVALFSGRVVSSYQAIADWIDLAAGDAAEFRRRRQAVGLG